MRESNLPVDWTKWDNVVISTLVWLFFIFVGFMGAVLCIAVAASVGGGLRQATSVGAWLYGITVVIWTVASCFMRERLARRWNSPLVVFPFDPKNRRSRLAKRRSIRRGLEPALVVCAWITGGAFTIALLATPFSINANGAPAPAAAVVVIRTLFIVMLAVLIVAVIWLGPKFARWGLAEYEAASARELAVLSERSNVPFEISSRLQYLNEFLEDVHAENWDKALREFEEYRRRNRRDSIALQIFFAFLGAAMGTALGFLLTLI